MLAACASTPFSPLGPTADMARVAKLSLGQSKEVVEASMARPGRNLSFPFKPDELVQIWRVEDHFASRCLFVTYDQSQRVKDIAVFERERDERGKFGERLPGSC